MPGDLDEEKREWLIRWLLDQAYHVQQDIARMQTKAQVMRDLAIELRSKKS